MGEVKEGSCLQMSTLDGDNNETWIICLSHELERD